ncbi:MAG: DUF5684 domain-containing protein [Flavobacteriales bacterium]
MQNNELMRLFSSEYAGYSFLGLFIFIIGAVGAARLFVKCRQPWVAAVVPVWNVVVLCKVVGRPVSHAWLLLVPIFNVYFVFKLFIELAQSFGKTSWVDYLLVCVFNVFYVLNLALSYDYEYGGPVYGASASWGKDTSSAIA